MIEPVAPVKKAPGADMKLKSLQPRIALVGVGGAGANAGRLSDSLPVPHGHTLATCRAAP